MPERSQFVNDVKAQLREWNQEIKHLESKLETAGDDTKERLEPMLAKAHDARKAVEAKLDEIESASEHTWHSLKTEAEGKWESFKHSVNHFKSQL